MKNVIMRNKDNGAIGIVMEKWANDFTAAIKKVTGADVEIFQPGKAPFELLPQEVKAEALDTLKAYNKVNVEYSNGRYHVTAGTYLAASYPIDHCVFGTYYAKDLYTEEQRRANFKEVFGYEMMH